MIDTGFVVKANKEAEFLVARMLSQKFNVSEKVIEDCITNVTTSLKSISDGEEVYIVHKVTKSNKNKPLYVHFAWWMIDNK